MKPKHYINLETQYGANNYASLDVVITKGQGIWVEDVDGNRYMDCLSAYSAVNQGHCHPKILQTMIEQAKRLTLTSRAFRNDQLGPFYEELCALTNSHAVLPMNSGVEAVETAIKVVRKWGYQVKGVPEGQAEIIVCANNFHGRTITIVGFSTDEESRAGFGPFTPGFKIIPFGDAKALENSITPNTVAFMVEPIQGEGGFYVAPPEFLKALRALCDEHGIMLICDEIQSGFARTGHMFYTAAAGIEPDLLTMAKGIAGGIPISAVVGKAEVMDTAPVGGLGGTYGGSPLGCSAALAVLEVIEEEKLTERAMMIERRFMESLGELKARYPDVIADVRGHGAMIALELMRDGDVHQPDAALTKAVIGKALEYGLILLACGFHGNVIRFLPPLTIPEAHLREGLDQFSALFNDVMASQS